MSPGPLGTGLMCYVNATGHLTEDACCSTLAGTACLLPEGSCCADGSCDRCGNITRWAAFPPLASTRRFVDNQCLPAH